MTEFKFPENFLWGAATSAHQAEGNNTLNDWWAWEIQSHVRERSGEACKHYELFEKDFDFAKELRHNAHRFSIEWSRVEPAPGKWNDQEIGHYRKVVDALRKRNIEPVVTLHHFTNPAWLAREGGWENLRVVDYFGRFVQKMAEVIGDSVRYWVTINEPMIFLYLSYVRGEWPPGGRSPRIALKVLKNMVLAHIRAYQTIHDVAIKQSRAAKPLVGLAQHMTAFFPCHPASWLDSMSAWLRHHFFNHLFSRSLHSGFLFFPGIYFEPLPMRRSFDFIGINYYTRNFIHFAGFDFPNVFGDDCSLRHHESTGKRNDMGWEVYPKGLFDLLLSLKEYRVPVLITENGICTPNDAERKEFIYRHLVEASRALQKNVPVIGYLYWSLMDNFEWAHGFGPRFGLLDIDYKTRARSIRDSARYFAAICKSNSITL